MKQYICYWSIDVNNGVPDDIEIVYFFNRKTGDLNFPDLNVGMNNWDGYVDITGSLHEYNKETKKFNDVVDYIIYKREMAYISQMVVLATKMLRTYRADMSELKGVVLRLINDVA